MGPDEHTVGFIERVSGEPYTPPPATGMMQAIIEAERLVSRVSDGPCCEIVSVDKNAGTITLKKYEPPRSIEGHVRWASERLLSLRDG